MSQLTSGKPEGRSGSRWVLVAAVVAFLASTLVGLYQLTQEFRTDRGEIRGTVLWLATEVDREYLRLLDTLSRYSLGDEAVTHDDLMLRLDLFWSQFNNFRSGEVGRRLISVTGAGETVAAVDAALTAMEPELQALQYGDVKTGSELRDRLAVHVTPIHQMSQSIDKLEQQYFIDFSSQTESALWLLTVFLLCMSLSGAALIVLLMRETRRANRMFVLSRDAERQVRDVNETLEQRIAERTAELETEILDRKRIENDLRSAEERFRQIFEHANVGNIVIDEDGTVESINSSAQAIFGYGSDEVVDQNINMLMPEPDRSRHDSFMQRYKETGEKRIIGIGREVMGLRKNGEEFPMTLGIGEVFIAGKRSFIGTVSDLTEYKLLERKLTQAQRMEAVGQLTGGLAHDFNNLLSIIIGNAELLEDSIEGNEAAQRRLTEMIGAVERGASLTSRLLAFSRQTALVPVATDVDALIRGVEELLQRTLGEDIEVKVVGAEEPWPALIDPYQFENALVNLALNARDAMPKGGTLTIETASVAIDEAYAEQHEEVTPGDYVMVAVSDTGCGMAPEIAAKAIEPFFTTKEVGQGSGLGLSMVYGFVKQSSGHISIYTEAGQGTTVRMYLPRSVEAPLSLEEKRDVTEISMGSGRILVVEDDPDVRYVPVRILRQQGYEVVEAENGTAALNHLRDSGRFDLLFTDLVLPGGMNGAEIAAEASRIDPDIKVLFTTGYAENAVLHDTRLDNGARFINKPYRKAELLRTVGDILEADQEALTGARVLLIEDDAVLRSTIGAGLRDAGFSVTEASGGTQGLDQLRSSGPDIVVSDIIMGEGEGIETLMETKAYKATLPFIAISGDGLYLRSASELGADAVLKKPFPVQVLVATINEVLSSRS